MLDAHQAADVADINHDCDVGSLDVSLAVSNWGPTNTACPVCLNADINLDGTVGQPDLDIVIDHWGRTCD